MVKKSSRLEDMIAYVDENGMITSTPPDPGKKNVIKSEDIEISIPRQEDIPFDPEKKGTVTFYNESKGFGFIRESETQNECFCSWLISCLSLLRKEIWSVLLSKRA